MRPKARPQQPAARHILATFSHVDRLLDNALRRAGIPATKAFGAEYDDFTADEVFLLSAVVEEVRSALLRLADSLQLERDTPTVPARWAAQTDWQFAEVALAELTGESLRAWGGADPDFERTLVAETTRLRARLAQARTLLAGGRPGTRPTPESLAPGPELAPLRPLFAARELAPMHGALRAAVDRLRDPDLVLGVFGRVSTGKSSLVNAVLDEPILPAGAIPMTRRIVRLGHGARALHLRGSDGAALGTKPWEERAQWLTGHPDSSYQCELRCPSVPPGTAWLDTPGLGATHPALGATAARAVWGCDLAILCLGAGALPGLDERAILARADAQTIPVHLVITQADRLRGEELQALREWLQANFSDTAASIVATATSGDPGLGQFNAALAPTLQSPAAVRDDGRRRRLRRLCAAARSIAVDSDRINSDLVASVDTAQSAIHAMIARAPQRGEEILAVPPAGT